MTRRERRETGLAQQRVAKAIVKNATKNDSMFRMALNQLPFAKRLRVAWAITRGALK